LAITIRMVILPLNKIYKSPLFFAEAKLGERLVCVVGV
ncbi:MAG: hypothetical protein ACI8WB_004831, partial [Phenylobacterium sp.]